MTDLEQNLFDKALKSWGARPPKTPADEASRQVMEQLSERQSDSWFAGSRWRLASAALGLALVLGAGWLAILRPAGPESPAREIALPPLSEDVLLLWLDDETPLYLTVAPPAVEGDS